jgi:hypothetical protein
MDIIDAMASIAVLVFINLLLAPLPHWFPILDIPDAMDLPAVVLERVVAEKTDHSLYAHVRGFVDRDESRIAL